MSPPSKYSILWPFIIQTLNVAVLIVVGILGYFLRAELARAERLRRDAAQLRDRLDRAE